jgi:hypothetical protein
MMPVFDPVGAPWRIDCCGTRFGARKKVVDMVGSAGEGSIGIPCAIWAGICDVC